MTSHAMTTTRTNITAIATVTEKVAVTKGVSKLKDLQQLYNVCRYGEHTVLLHSSLETMPW